MPYGNLLSRSYAWLFSFPPHAPEYSYDEHYFIAYRLAFCNTLPECQTVRDKQIQIHNRLVSGKEFCSQQDFPCVLLNISTTWDDIYHTAENVSGTIAGNWAYFCKLLPLLAERTSEHRWHRNCRTQKRLHVVWWVETKHWNTRLTNSFGQITVEPWRKSTTPYYLYFYGALFKRWKRHQSPSY